LKKYLRTLPDELLINEKLENMLIGAVERHENRDEQMTAVWEVFNDNENEHAKGYPWNSLNNSYNLKPILEKLFKFLQKVVKEEEFNKMGARNLAIVFAPTLFQSSYVPKGVPSETHITTLAYIIEFADYFFPDQIQGKESKAASQSQSQSHSLEEIKVQEPKYQQLKKTQHQKIQKTRPS